MKKGEQALRLREPSIDDIMEFRGHGHSFDSECGIKIWGIKSSPTSLLTKRHVVVMTELPDSKGLSVTNAVEIIASQVMEVYLKNADLDGLIWIEHYPPRGRATSLRIEESYDLVSLRFDGREFKLDTSSGSGWKRLTEDDLRQIGIL